MRKMITKLLLSMLTVFALLGGYTSTAWASESESLDITFGPSMSSNPETGYYIRIDDAANLLSISEETELQKYMEPISDYGNVAFVSIDNNPEYSTERYAKGYYKEHFGSSSGVLLLIDMEERYIWIYSQGEIYDTVTTAYANTITDNVYSYATRHDYLTCASKAFTQINTLLQGKPIAQPMKYISNALLSVAIALLINYFLVMALSHSRKPSNSQLLDGIFSKTQINNSQAQFVRQTKRYSPQSSSSSGARSGGGSRSFSGGGSRGGGGGHRF